MNGTRTKEAVARPAEPVAAPLARARAGARVGVSPAGVLTGGPSRALDPAARSLLEHRFGRSLADVRVHDDKRAAQSALAAGALAYTVGQDIYFGEGVYQPDARPGLEVLAHEVAHTIQQHGVARGAAPTGETPAESILEREASAAARLAVVGPPVAGLAGQALRARRATPVVSFLKGRKWVDLPRKKLEPKGIETEGGKVEKWAQLAGEPAVGAFKIPEFHLPEGKGPVKAIYEAAASAGSLEAKVGFSDKTAKTVDGKPFAALWQGRAPTAELRDNWLAKVGWSKAEADVKWGQAGGRDGDTAFRDGRNPRLATNKPAIDMDHIVELQIGGSNVSANIQPLDREANQRSGSEIWRFVSAVASDLVGYLTGRNRTVTLSFEPGGVVQAPGVSLPRAPKPGKADHGWEVDWAAMHPGGSTSPATSKKAAVGGAAPVAAGMQAYPVVAGAQEATFQVPQGTSDVKLRADAVNLRGAEVVPGLLLNTLTRKNKPHTITADVDDGNYFNRAKGTRVPITLAGGSKGKSLKVEEEVDKKGRHSLKLQNPSAADKFTYPFLSEGFLRFSLEDTGLVGVGELRPSVPLLNGAVIKVGLADGVFDGSLAVPPSQIRLPGIPQFRCTRSDLNIALAPELRITGTLGFEVGRMLAGELTAEPSSTGLVAKGTIRAQLPHVEHAEGTVTYRDKQLNGEIMVRSNQLASLPGRPQGEVRIGFDDQGVHPSGALTVLLPGGEQAHLSVSQSDRGYLFTGRSTFAIPGLEPVGVDLRYDGEHLEGEGSSGVTLAGLTGTVHVHYRDGHFSGAGTAAVRRGRAQGTVTLHLSPAGNVHGEGTLRFQITDAVAATVGVDKPEQGPLRVRGALELPSRIVLFEGMHERNEVFHRSLDIPILGIATPIGSAGLIARVTGAFGYSYTVGPGTIDNARVTAGFNPLATDAEVALQASARLAIPASVGFFVSVRGGVGLSAVVGSVTGGLKVTGDVEARGGAFADFVLDYRGTKFLAAIDARVEATPTLRVTLKSDITAEALAGRWTHAWNWDLAEREWGSAFRLAMTMPIRYASDEPFRLPLASDIRFEGPDLNLARMLPELARMAGV